MYGYSFSLIVSVCDLHKRLNRPQQIILLGNESNNVNENGAVMRSVPVGRPSAADPQRPWPCSWRARPRPASASGAVAAGTASAAPGA